MQFDKFQRKIGKIVIYTEAEVPGLAESMQVAEEGVEVMREFRRSITKNEPLDEKAVKEELGDVLKSIATICNAKGWSMDSIAKDCLEKQEDRNEDRVPGVDGNNQ